MSNQETTITTPLFDLELSAVGEEGAGFRLDERPPYLTGHRRSGLTVRVGLTREIPVVRKILVENQTENEYKTLIVLSFAFISPSSKNRFYDAEIELLFRTLGGDSGSYIKIFDQFPKEDDTLYINPSPRKSKETFSLGGNAWVATPIGPIAGRIIEKSKESEFQVTDMGRVTGTSFPDGKWSAKRANVALFTASENPTMKQGIPNHFTVAIVLSSNTEKFKMDTKITAKGGLKYSVAGLMEKLFGRLPEAESVKFPFHPGKVLLKWEERHGEITKDDLEKVVLKDLTEIHEPPLLPVKEDGKEVSHEKS